MTVSRLTSYLLYLLMLISVGFIGWFFFGDYVAGTEGTPSAEPMATDKILMWAFILFLIAAAVSILFPLFYLVLNPRNAFKSLIILAAIAALVFVSYSLASDETLNMINYTGPDNIPATLKRADTGLILTYILAGLAVFAIIYTEIAKMFK